MSLKAITDQNLPDTLGKLERSPNARLVVDDRGAFVESADQVNSSWPPDCANWIKYTAGQMCASLARATTTFGRCSLRGIRDRKSVV